MEKGELRTLYYQTERFTVVILLLALPAFGMVYLYQQSGSLSGVATALPAWISYGLLGVGVSLLGFQYLLFHQKIKQSAKLFAITLNIIKCIIHCLCLPVSALQSNLTTVWILQHQFGIYWV